MSCLGLIVFLSQLTQARPVNMVFILADDCTYLDMEVYGGPAKTPNMNKLAKQGLKFTRCYQAAPMCSPTRHALYTGVYPVKNGAHPNHAEAYPHMKSIAHYLQIEGYEVVLAGKSHVSPSSVFPFTQLEEFADPKDKDVPQNAAGWRYPQIFNVMKQSSQANKAFCLFLASNEPHSPYTKGDATPYENVKLSPQQLSGQRKGYAKYLAEITYFDGQVGEIMSMLDKLGISENTLLMVASEQGSAFPFGKWTCYEVGVASGLIARWPGKVKAGSESSAIVEYTDIVPTFLEAAGADIPEIIDGKSFLPILKGDKLEHSQYAYSIQTTRGVNKYKDPFGIRSVVGKHYRYIRNLFPENEFSIPSSRGIYKESRKMDEKSKSFGDKYLRRPAEELYDIAKDPYCQNNLVANPELTPKKEELSQKLDEWMKQQGDQGRQTELDAYHRQAEWRRSQNPKLKNTKK